MGLLAAHEGGSPEAGEWAGGWSGRGQACKLPWPALAFLRGLWGIAVGRKDGQVLRRLPCPAAAEALAGCDDYENAAPLHAGPCAAPAIHRAVRADSVHANRPASPAVRSLLFSCCSKRSGGGGGGGDVGRCSGAPALHRDAGADGGPRLPGAAAQGRSRAPCATPLLLPFTLPNSASPARQATVPETPSPDVLTVSKPDHLPLGRRMAMAAAAAGRNVDDSSPGKGRVSKVPRVAGGAMAPPAAGGGHKNAYVAVCTQVLSGVPPGGSGRGGGMQSCHARRRQLACLTHWRQHIPTQARRSCLSPAALRPSITAGGAAVWAHPADSGGAGGARRAQERLPGARGGAPAHRAVLRDVRQERRRLHGPLHGWVDSGGRSAGERAVLEEARAGAALCRAVQRALRLSCHCAPTAPVLMQRRGCWRRWRPSATRSPSAPRASSAARTSSASWRAACEAAVAALGGGGNGMWRCQASTELWARGQRSKFRPGCGGPLYCRHCKTCTLVVGRP